jgi:50S ribosomal subunit-associated GTPase HflX
VVRLALAGARLRAQGLDAHALHERAHVAPPDMNALVLQLAAQHACAHEGVLQVQLVDAAHERQVEPHRESRRPVGLSQTDLV